MDNDIPPVRVSEINEKGQLEGKLEEMYNDAAAAAESSYKYGKYFHARADEINIQILYWGILLIILLFLIIFSTCISNHFFKKSINILIKATNIPNYTSALNSTHVIAIYYLSKISLYGFLITMFVWVARIFNQLRRLEITYRDKYIIAETYEKFIQNSRDESSHEVIREHAHKSMFSLTLGQAEANLKKKGLSEDEILKILLEVIKNIKDK